MRTLVEAYACRPGAGSEYGFGWHLPLELARRGVAVTVVTSDVSRDEIETAVAAARGAEGEAAGDPGALPRFVFVARRAWPMRLGLGWTVGSALQYVLWLWDAASVARRLDAQQPFDIVHHATYGSLLGGTFLWRLTAGRVSAGPGRPALVLGPLGGGQTTPPAFAPLFGRLWRDEALRTFVIRHLWPVMAHARLAARRSAAVLATNRETAALARRLGARRVERSLDVALPPAFVARAAEVSRNDERGDAGPPGGKPSGAAGEPDLLKALWVGRIMPRKGLPLAVMAVDRAARRLRAEGGGPDVRLEIVGGGVNEETEATFRAWLETQPGKVQVTMRGSIPFEEVGDVYAGADLFVFPSVRDSTGVQLLEAMAFGLPVVCLDHQGARELVTPDVGIRVPVGGMEGTVDGLARAIVDLARDPARRRRMGVAGRALAEGYTWEARAGELVEVFGSILDS